ncbi:GDSL-type esterase/lipase family protein [Chloroflexota bacterium]
MRNAWRLLAFVLAALWGLSSLFPARLSFAGTSPPSIDIQDIRLLTVATDSSGSVWAAWEADSGADIEILYSRRTGEGWLPPQVVASRPLAWDRAPSLAIAADGVPWLAWSTTEKETPGHSQILVSSWDGEGWTSPEPVPLGIIAAEDCPACLGAMEPTLAASPDGTLWLAWVGFDGVGDGIFAQRWDGSAWTQPQQVSADDLDPSLYDRQPRLGIGGDSRPWLVWTGFQGGVDDEIYASRWTGSRWAPEQMVSIDDESLDTRPALWVDAQGQPWVAWQARIVDELLTTQPATEEVPGQSRILASTWDPSRRAWALEMLVSSSLSVGVDETLPALSDDEQGVVRAAWFATGATGSALAQSSWDGRRWTAALLAGDDVPAEGAAWVRAGGGAPVLVWLDPGSQHQAPLGWAAIDDGAAPLASWAQAQAPPEYFPLASVVPNRHMAFGDSVTAGIYVAEQDRYPWILEGMLKLVVGGTVVENYGEPGEGIPTGRNRLKDEIGRRRPQYILFMEGTNDVSRGKTPAEIKSELLNMIAMIRTHPVQRSELMLATIVPRLSGHEGKTEEMNNVAIKPAAQEKGVPLCDQWQAFDSSPLPLSSLIRSDEIHPSEAGLQLIADTFYACVLIEFFGMSPDDQPPTTWVEPLPVQSECGQVAVNWNGTDNLSYVVEYDVQVKVNDGAWTDWLLGTTATNGVYTGGAHGDTLYFWVRGRDVAGNQSIYGAAEDTSIQDTLPPSQSGVHSLSPANTAPFNVSWWGQDACSEVTSYDVQYKAGAGGAWTDWLPGTPDSSAGFAPGSPIYGETYYFQVKAEDALGNKQSTWSAPASTVLARFALSGSLLSNREEPLAMATLTVDPGLPFFTRYHETYSGYGIDPDDLALTATRNGFGNLPPMKLTAVSTDVTDLDFYLPPADDAVLGGGFESGLADWLVAGTLPPALTVEAHTGDGAVGLGDLGQRSQLSQVVSPKAGMIDPTLTFMFRLEQPGAGSSLEVTLEDGNAAAASFVLDDVVAVQSDSWSHVWYDVTGETSSPLTITFTVSNSANIILDEISLGSAPAGGGWIYLPTVLK